MMIFVLAPFIALAAILIIGTAAGAVWDYFDYKHGNIGWYLVPRPMKTLWRRCHPNEPIVEYRKGGGNG